MCLLGGAGTPAAFYCDLHFNFADVFNPICSHPTCIPGVGGEGLHFELQKTLFPECVQTCWDVPLGFLASSFPPLTPPFPWADVSVSINYLSAGKKFHRKTGSVLHLQDWR